MPVYVPELTLLIIGILLLLAEAFLNNYYKKYIPSVCILGLLLAFCLTFFSNEPSSFIGYKQDTLSNFFRKYAILATILVIFLTSDYSSILKKYLSGTNNKKNINTSIYDFYIIPIFTCIGLMWVVSANDLINVFVALELVTISFFVLVIYMRFNVGSIESGVKYLVLGALSTGLLVFGFTWLYGVTGEVNLDQIAKKIYGYGNQNSIDSSSMSVYTVFFALALIICGLSFKISAFPFHVWVPDVYQGAPTPISAYLSVASKAAGFVVFYRLISPFLESEVFAKSTMFTLLLMACMTIIIGNFGAIRQTNFKRLLGYSSISHSGFLLLLICCSTSKAAPSSVQVMCFYFFGYLLMNIILFYSLVLVRVNENGENISDFNGYYNKNSIISTTVLVSSASLAGVPLTIGFLGKFFLLNLVVNKSIYFILAITIIGFGVGFFYYFKIIAAIYWNKPNNSEKIKISLSSQIILIILTICILFFGIYIEPLFRIIG